MSKIFVIMKERRSPLAVYQASPHEAHEDKNIAMSRVDELNKKATVNYYWCESVRLNHKPT